MDTKKFALGTIAGGVAMFITGYLIYGLALRGFYEANMINNVSLETPRFLWLILGNLGFAAFYTYIFVKWTGIKTFATGAKAGAVLGVLLGLGFSLTWYGTANLMTLTGAFVDVVVNGVMTAVVCGVIGMVVGRE
jgi:hypothetical protein